MKTPKEEENKKGIKQEEKEIETEILLIDCLYQTIHTLLVSNPFRESLSYSLIPSATE